MPPGLSMLARCRTRSLPKGWRSSRAQVLARKRSSQTGFQRHRMSMPMKLAPPNPNPSKSQIERPGHARADIADEVGGIRVGRIGVKAEVARVEREQRKERDDVEREPEAGDDLLEERKAGEIFGPRLALRQSTTRHAKP